MTATSPMLTRLASTIGRVGCSRSKSARTSSAAPGPSRRTPATAGSWVCSWPVMVARFAAHAWIESAVSVCESSTGLDWSISVVSGSRFLRASMASVVLP